MEIRKIFVLVLTLLICLSNLVIFKTDLYIQAESGGTGGAEISYENYLNFTYLWKVVNDFSNVVHYTPLWTDGIRKGRAYGTNGDR